MISWPTPISADHAAAGPAALSLLGTGPLHRRVRLATGSILFLYVATHLLNHSMGNISLAAMETVLLAQKWFWQGVIGTLLLYVSLTTHGLLGVMALYARRYVGWTLAETVQIVLGLSLPVLLANHVAVTRGAWTFYGLNKGYAQELTALGLLTPGWGIVQVLALIAAWSHGCIGLRLALCLKPWYPRFRQALLIAAVLLPVLALLGFGQGVREAGRDLPDPAWRSATLAVSRAGTPAESHALADLRNGWIAGYLCLLALVLAARGLRAWSDTRRRGIAVAYPDGTIARVPRAYRCSMPAV